MLNAQVGLQAAPEAYLTLGTLNGNPSKGPLTAMFNQNPDFYNGSITVRTPTPQQLQAAGIQPLIFGGLLANIDWKGLGLTIAKRAIDLLEYVSISNFPLRRLKV